MTEIKSGDVVRIHYTGKLTDGTPVDSSRQGDPVEFKVGAGQIMPGIERHVEGMAVGAASTVTVPAEEAFGPHDKARVQDVPRTAFPPEVQLEMGARLQANTQDGQTLDLTVVGLDEEKVTVDANHPLAGEDLVFEIEVVERVG
ncbi:MAG: peptidylprolyl isomerase [Mesorhizobium sp.]|nr:peptidylprolyl isomerase [Mesorhizobium sp.]